MNQGGVFPDLQRRLVARGVSRLNLLGAVESYHVLEFSGFLAKRISWIDRPAGLKKNAYEPRVNLTPRKEHFTGWMGTQTRAAFSPNRAVGMGRPCSAECFIPK